MKDTSTQRPRRVIELTEVANSVKVNKWFMASLGVTAFFGTMWAHEKFIIAPEQAERIEALHQKIVDNRTCQIAWGRIPSEILDNPDKHPSTRDFSGPPPSKIRDWSIESKAVQYIPGLTLCMAFGTASNVPNTYNEIHYAVSGDTKQFIAFVPGS